MEGDAPKRAAVFTPQLENLFIEHAIRVPDDFARTMKAFNPAYFSANNQAVVRFIREFWEKHKAMPGKPVVEAETGVKPVGDAEYEGDREWYAGRIKEFHKYKHAQQAVFAASQELESGDFAIVGKSLEEAFNDELVREQTGRRVSDAEWFRGVLAGSRENMFSTGWPTIDKKLEGGFSRGHMNMFVASTGVGKSIALANVALNLAEQGLKILFVTSEMKDEDVARRLAKMLTGKKTMGNLTDEQIAALQAELATYSLLNDVVIEEMMAPTAGELDALIRQHALAGVEFDALVLDYMDLCMPTDPRLASEQVWTRDAAMTWEMKDMVETHNLIFVTACQTNTNVKDRKPGEHYDQHMIAGGQSKIRAVVNAIFMERVTNLKEIREAEQEQEKENRKKNPAEVEIPEYSHSGYKFFMVKCRYAESGSALELNWDRDYLRIRDFAAPAAKPEDSMFQEDGVTPKDKRLREMVEGNRKRRRK